MDVKIENLENYSFKILGIENWPIWTKEKSIFDWHYDTIEECYILDGRVKIHTENGESFELKKGDFVTFEEGLSCRWEVFSEGYYSENS